MLQILKNPRYDFMSWGNACMAGSGVLMLIALAIVAVRGIDYGIEFTGGTEVQVKYAEPPDVGAIRATLGQAGLTNQIVTSIGSPEEHEVYIRVGGTEQGDHDMTSRIVAALRGPADPDRVDLNVADRTTLRQLLREAPGLVPEQIDPFVERIVALRRERAILGNIDDLAQVEGLAPEVLQHLRQRTFVGPLAIRSQSYIGPVVGRELLQKTFFAVAGSLLGVLAYIWIRFQFQWGLAAVIALLHDTVLTLGLFALFDKEMSLPVVAAFLTLIGYSVNDTVVIFDRVRENLKGSSSSAVLSSLINTSINQTLSRTLLTSGLTWTSVVALYLFGGAALNAFAFVMVVGIVVGSYSTIYIASPVLLLWKRLVERRTQPGGAVALEPPARAKKIRQGSGSRPS